MAVTACPSASAQEISKIGSFADVRSDDGGEHCSGYSLALWRLDDRIFGLLDKHEGLCGDPPCIAIDSVQYEAESGLLRFRFDDANRTVDFDGSLDPSGVRGALEGQTVHLLRVDGRGRAHFQPDRRLPDWCAFWMNVPRCENVGELCEMLNSDN